MILAEWTMTDTIGAAICGALAVLMMFAVVIGRRRRPDNEFDEGKW